jgi:hypothetical protein
VKAFTVFTAAVALKDPAQVVELLAYQLKPSSRRLSLTTAYSSGCTLWGSSGSDWEDGMVEAQYRPLYAVFDRTSEDAAVLHSVRQFPAHRCELPFGSGSSSKPAASPPLSGDVHGAQMFANCSTPLLARLT